jgi:hypothetical protein
MSEEIKPRRLAIRFGKILRRYMTEREYRLVIYRNRTEKDNLVCHSHDFCDANMAMFDALVSLGVDKRDLSRLMCTPGIINTLWMDAWNLWFKDPWIGVSWRKAEENRYRMMRWRSSLDRAKNYMASYEDSDYKIVLQMCGEDEGIGGLEMPSFIEWAEGFHRVG